MRISVTPATATTSAAPPRKPRAGTSGSALLSWYLGSFADYDATYGSLGAGIGLMMWLWMTAIVVLVGAELNSEIDRARLDGVDEDGIGRG